MGCSTSFGLGLLCCAKSIFGRTPPFPLELKETHLSAHHHLASATSSLARVASLTRPLASPLLSSTSGLPETYSPIILVSLASCPPFGSLVAFPFPALSRSSNPRSHSQDTAYIACRTTTNNLALATPHSFTRSTNNNSNNGSRIIKPLQHGPWSLRHNRCPQASPSPQASLKSLLAWIVGRTL